MTYELLYKKIVDTNEQIPVLTHSDDYSVYLNQYSLSYKSLDIHLLVGEIKQTQGWILHISVVRSQIQSLLIVLLPKLISWGVPFKVLPNKEIAQNLLNGNLGIERIGKVITLFPSCSEEALALAKELIPLTKEFKGPKIHTDVHLGSIIYTRFGSHNPLIMVDTTGKQQRYIYNIRGELILDACPVPFSMPEGIEWPFMDLVPPLPVKQSNAFHKKYKPVVYLKIDPKGNVLKSLYLKNHFQLKWCIVKEGIKNMWSDDAGRDIADRLLWQYQLHKKLAPILPTPQIIDLFREDENTYLVLEFIKGQSLINSVYKLNSSCSKWCHLPVKTRIEILNYILQILNILEKFHFNGIVHRDITPVNFLVNKKNKLYIIDNELAYSFQDKAPTPPFEAGTYGFMSPEQLEQQTPTDKEDIYALGATMLVLLTGISPQTFDVTDQSGLRHNLNFFIQNKLLIETISSCLNIDSHKRPTLDHIRIRVQSVQKELRTTWYRSKSEAKIEETENKKINDLIQKGINGLVMQPTIIHDDLWYSKASNKKNGFEKEQSGFTKTTGLREGISGVLYLLGKAKLAGFDISRCLKAYHRGFEYIKNAYVSSFPNVPPGLFGGTAGIALSIASGIDSNLIDKSDPNRDFLHKCFDIATSELNIEVGIAGQGISLLQCANHLEKQFYQQSLVNHAQALGSILQASWNKTFALPSRSATDISISLTKGSLGMVYFLLLYTSTTEDKSFKEMLISILNSGKNVFKQLNTIFKKFSYRQLLLESPGLLKIAQEVILVYLKGYEIFKDNDYKIYAEDLLSKYPRIIVQDNLYQDSGLAGLGELYLEASNITGNQEWLYRANSIAQFFIHTSHERNNDYCFWLSNNFRFSTADLLAGNSGLIHFLIRYLNPDKMGYCVIGVSSNSRKITNF